MSWMGRTDTYHQCNRLFNWRRENGNSGRVSKSKNSCDHYYLSDSWPVSGQAWQCALKALFYSNIKFWCKVPTIFNLSSKICCLLYLPVWASIKCTKYGILGIFYILYCKVCMANFITFYIDFHSFVFSVAFICLRVSKWATNFLNPTISLQSFCHTLSVES